MSSVSPPPPTRVIGRPRPSSTRPCCSCDLGRFDAQRRPAVVGDRGGWQELAAPSEGPQVAVDRPAPDGLRGDRRHLREDLRGRGHGRRRHSRASSSPTSSPPRRKVERAARLQARAEVMICADDPFHVRLASEVGDRPPASRSRWSSTSTSGWTGPASRPGARRWSSPARSTGRRGIRLAGIMGYEGHVLTAWPNEEKRAPDRRGRWPA